MRIAFWVYFISLLYAGRLQKQRAINDSGQCFTQLLNNVGNSGFRINLPSDASNMLAICQASTERVFCWNHMRIGTEHYGTIVEILQASTLPETNIEPHMALLYKGIHLLRTAFRGSVLSCIR